MEPFVGAFRSAFPGKHARRIFAFALKRKNTGSIRKFAGNIFTEIPFENVAPGFVAGHGDFRNFKPRQRNGMRFHLDLFIPDPVDVVIVFV